VGRTATSALLRLSLNTPAASLLSLFPFVGIKASRHFESSRMKKALKQLLDTLDTISEAHPEVGDTEVREHMARAVEKGFIMPRANYRVPQKFGMYSIFTKRDLPTR
jgi:hypothetical protein